jgi:flagellar basal body-associated protein FliL
MIKKISKKKLYIIGIVVTSILASAITIPIVIGSSNKENKNEKKIKRMLNQFLKFLIMQL